MKVNHVQNSSDLEDILNELESDVFSKNNWTDNNFYKIAEVTYSYDNSEWSNINTTLFCDLGWLNINTFKSASPTEKEKLLEDASGNLLTQIDDKISKIKNAKLRIESLHLKDDAKSKIILWGLRENILLLKKAKAGLPLEREKALIWLYFQDKENEYKWLFTEEKRKSIRSEVQELNTEIYWPNLSKNPEYIQWIMDYYHTKYKEYQNKQNLEASRVFSEDEQIRYESYLTKIQALHPSYTPKNKLKPEKYIDSLFDDIDIDKSDINNIFNHHFQSIDVQTWNMKQISELDDNVWSMSDTPNGISYPNKEEKFNTLKLSRVLKLMSHEIEQHANSLVTHEALVWNIRWAQNLELAEWTAKLNEDLFEFGPNILIDSTNINGVPVKIIDIEKLGYVSNFSKTLMEEILTDEEFYDFLSLNEKVEPDKTSPLSRYLRHKRNWFQMKDVTYTTGKIKAAEYMNATIKWEIEWDFSDLFIGKVWFDQIPLMKQLVDENWESSHPKKIPEVLFFHDALYFSVIQRKNGEKITSEEFHNYLIKKYSFIDISKEKIESISFGYKKQLLWALSLTESAINTYDVRQKSKNILEK